MQTLVLFETLRFVLWGYAMARAMHRTPKTTLRGR